VKAPVITIAIRVKKLVITGAQAALQVRAVAAASHYWRRDSLYPLVLRGAWHQVQRRPLGTRVKRVDAADSGSAYARAELRSEMDVHVDAPRPAVNPRDTDTCHYGEAHPCEVHLGAQASDGPAAPWASASCPLPSPPSFQEACPSALAQAAELHDWWCAWR